MTGRCDMHNPRGKRTVAEIGADRLAVDARWHRRPVTRSTRPAATRKKARSPGSKTVLPQPARASLGGPDLERVKNEWRRSPAARGLGVYTNTEIGNGLPETVRRLAVTRSYRPDRAGEVYAILKPGWIWFYEKNAGTTHGQPNDDDTHVPVAAWGVGVAAGSYDTPTSPLAIAKTVGALFGFEIGEPDVQPLAPVLGSAHAAEPSRKVAAARR
jgi:hypothetical protein